MTARSGARRVVSLVPSLTEAVASVDASALVGVTDWCTHPAGLDARRVRGTKNPDTAAIIELNPDVVLANREENREIDVARLRAAGLPVWVSTIDSLQEAFDELDAMFVDVLRWDAPAWLPEARRLWATPLPDRGTCACPIWRDPWMVVGGRTFTSDVLAHLGWRNVFAGRPRYPHVELHEIVDAALAAPAGLDAMYTGRDGDEVSLRWVLTHMLQEYARHAGHADLMREMIDGEVGE